MYQYAYNDSLFFLTHRYRKVMRGNIGFGTWIKL